MNVDKYISLIRSLIFLIHLLVKYTCDIFLNSGNNWQIYR